MRARERGSYSVASRADEVDDVFRLGSDPPSLQWTLFLRVLLWLGLGMDGLHVKVSEEGPIFGITHDVFERVFVVRQRDQERDDALTICRPVNQF